MQCTRILAIRHGETAWNQEARIQGQLDIPLNAHGLWQASQAAQALREEAIAAIYTSDLQRAVQTAQPLAQQHQQPLQLHPGLRERHFGECQGYTWAELAERSPDITDAWRRRVPEFAPPGGESLLDLRARVVNTFHELAERHVGEQIVVVAHGGVLDIVYRAAARVDLQSPRTWSLANAGINRVLWTPEGLTLVGWGDVSHLEGTSQEETFS